MAGAQPKDAGGAAAPSEAPAPWLPLLASLPLALVALGGVLCATYVYLHREMFRTSFIREAAFRAKLMESNTLALHAARATPLGGHRPPGKMPGPVAEGKEQLRASIASRPLSLTGSDLDSVASQSERAGASGGPSRSRTPGLDSPEATASPRAMLPPQSRPHSRLRASAPAALQEGPLAASRAAARARAVASSLQQLPRGSVQQQCAGGSAGGSSPRSFAGAAGGPGEVSTTGKRSPADSLDTSSAEDQDIIALVRAKGIYPDPRRSDPGFSFHETKPEPFAHFELVFTDIYCSVPDSSPGSSSSSSSSSSAAAAAGASSCCCPGVLTTWNEQLLGAGGAPAGLKTHDSRGHKIILHHVSGTARAGDVVGVLGPSGSGKSTLLGILSCTNTDVSAASKVSGAISLGGESRRSQLAKLTSFVPQSDVLFPSLTVAECLLYSALLRLAPATPLQHVRARLLATLQELGLLHVADSLVGGSAAVRGVSGGERRRVTIGMELVVAPKVVVMDEPTSGLDSFTAANLLQTCKQVAARGRVVIASLHQPSPDMFEALDWALLLAKGHLVYAGPPGAAAGWFAEAGMPVPGKRSVAEHMLMCVSDEGRLAQLVDSGRGAGVPSRAGSPGPATLPLLAAAAAADPQDICGRPASRPGSRAEGEVQGGAGGAGGAAGPGAPQHILQWVQQVDLAAGRDAAAGPGNCADSTAASSLRRAHSSGASSLRSSGTGSVSSRAELHKQPSPAHLLHGSRLQAADPAAAPAASLGSHEPKGSGRLQRHQQLWADEGRIQAGGGGVRRALHSSARTLGVLFWRAGTDMARTPSLLLMHLVVGLGMGLLVGLVFYQQQYNTAGAQNRAGAMFFTLCLFGFMSLTVVDGLMLERALVLRETRGRYYSTWPYLATKLILDALLLRLAPILLYTAALYPLMGLDALAVRLAIFILVLAVFSCTIGALSIAVAALSSSSGAAMLLLNMLLLLWVLIGGFLVNTASIPWVIRWLKYTSPMAPAFEALLVNEMKGQRYTLSVDGYDAISGVKAETFIKAFGLDPDRMPTDILALVVFYAGFLVLAFLLLRASVSEPYRRVRGVASRARAHVHAGALRLFGIRS